MNKITNIEHIDQFNGFGLYDRDFIEILRNLNDPIPYLRGMVAELGYSIKKINFEQLKRKHGKSRNNFYSLYDMSMIGITSYSKTFLRIATFIGIIIGFISFLISILYLFLKLLFWDKFPMGTAPILIGIFFLGSIQLFFIGILGEYIMSINNRVLNRPLVIEEERINFDFDEN